MLSTRESIWRTKQKETKRNTYIITTNDQIHTHKWIQRVGNFSLNNYFIMIKLIIKYLWSFCRTALRAFKLLAKKIVQHFVVLHLFFPSSPLSVLVFNHFNSKIAFNNRESFVRPLSWFVAFYKETNSFVYKYLCIQTESKFDKIAIQLREYWWQWNPSFCIKWKLNVFWGKCTEWNWEIVNNKEKRRKNFWKYHKSWSFCQWWVNLWKILYKCIYMIFNCLTTVHPQNNAIWKKKINLKRRPSLKKIVLHFSFFHFLNWNQVAFQLMRININYVT